MTLVQERNLPHTHTYYMHIYFCSEERESKLAGDLLSEAKVFLMVDITLVKCTTMFLQVPAHDFVSLGIHHLKNWYLISHIYKR